MYPFIASLFTVHGIDLPCQLSWQCTNPQLTLHLTLGYCHSQIGLCHNLHTHVPALTNMFEAKRNLMTVAASHFCSCQADCYKKLVYSMQGYLPTNFRTDWCKDFFKGKCSRGKLCSRAHSLEQLQVDAAIEAGKLDQRFKMQFCGDANSGTGTLCLALSSCRRQDKISHGLYTS